MVIECLESNNICPHPNSCIAWVCSQVLLVTLFMNGLWIATKHAALKTK